MNLDTYYILHIHDEDGRVVRGIRFLPNKQPTYHEINEWIAEQIEDRGYSPTCGYSYSMEVQTYTSVVYDTGYTIVGYVLIDNPCTVYCRDCAWKNDALPNRTSYDDVKPVTMSEAKDRRCIVCNRRIAASIVSEE